MDLESQHESIREGFNKVLEAHGFGDHEVTSFTASDVPAPTATGMCRVWLGLRTLLGLYIELGLLNSVHDLSLVGR